MNSFGLSSEQRSRLCVQKRAGDAFAMFEYIAGCGKRGATCDECLRALGLTHQSGSPRFGELMGSGCIVPTGEKRATSSGKQAAVCVLSEEGSFLPYLSYRPRSKAKGLSVRDEAILGAGRAFLTRMARVRSEAKQQDAVDALLRALIAIDGSAV